MGRQRPPRRGAAHIRLAPHNTHDPANTQPVRLAERSANPGRGAGEASRQAGPARSAFDAIVETAHEGICTVDGDGRVIFANRRMADLTGREPETLEGMELTSLLGRDISGPLEAAKESAPSLDRTEVRAPRPDGTLLDAIVSITPVAEPDSEARWVVMAVDVTLLRRTEEELTRSVLYDRLTGLPNRTLFVDRVDDTLSRAERRARALAVMVIDLDRFDLINDSLGYETGDRVLEMTAERLLRSVRPGDTVARIGGDRFAVACETPDDERRVRMIAERLGEAIHVPMELGETPLVITACVGIAVAHGLGAGLTRNGRASSGTTLLREADAALHQAKERGRSSIEIFHERVRARAFSRLEAEADLRRAVGEGEFLVHYQPSVSLPDGRIVGVEALVRWDHPQWGLVAPSRFIPLAEETGLVVPIGELVLREACNEAAAWSRTWRGPDAPGVAVNISGRQLTCATLVDQVQDALEASGLDPSQLTLEITESVLVADGEAAHDTLARLRDLGVRLGVDDFGTGYASLLYLRRFPFDAVKIDRSFVAGVGVDPEDSAIVRGVIGLAHALGLPATAEGVETRAQMDVLRSFACDLAQGFYISKPLPACEILGLLENWAPPAGCDLAG